MFLSVPHLQTTNHSRSDYHLAYPSWHSCGYPSVTNHPDTLCFTISCFKWSTPGIQSHPRSLPLILAASLLHPPPSHSHTYILSLFISSPDFLPPAPTTDRNVVCPKTLQPDFICQSVHHHCNKKDGVFTSHCFLAVLMHDTTDFLMQLTLLLLKLSFLDELHHRGGFYNNFQMKIINYNKFFIYQKKCINNFIWNNVWNRDGAKIVSRCTSLLSSSILATMSMDKKKWPLPNSNIFFLSFFLFLNVWFMLRHC